MKFWVLVLFLTFVCLELHSDELLDTNDFILKNHTISGSAENYMSRGDGRFNRTSLNFNKQFNFYDFSLDVDLEAYHHSRNMDNHKNVSLKFEKRNDVQINSVMLSYINEDYGVHIGAIPFRGSRFAELKNPLRHGGNGIELLTDQVFVGGFVSTKINDVSIILGHAEWRKEANYNSLGYNNNDKSTGTFVMAKRDIGKHYLEFNYFRINAILDSSTEPIDYMTLDLIGLGYIYDDTLKSGLTFTFEGGISHNNENNRALAETTGVPINILRSMGYIVDNMETTGYAYKTNLRYENEIFNVEYYVGAEYFKTYDNWVSMNHGVLFLSNNSYWQHKDGNQVTLYGGVYITKDLFVQLRYAKSKSDKVPNYFSVSAGEGIQNSPTPENFFTETTRVELEISYSF